MTDIDTEAALTDALTKAVVALGRAGRPEEASRIAARAYADVRHSSPRSAQKLSNAMHGIVRMPGMPQRPSGLDQNSGSGRDSTDRPSDPQLEQPQQGESDD